MIAAARLGELDILDRLLNLGLDPTTEDNNALRWAAANGHTSCVRRLLRDARVRAKATVHENEAVVSALANGYAETAAVILDACPTTDPLDDGGEALRLAVERGHVGSRALIWGWVQGGGG